METPDTKQSHSARVAKYLRGIHTPTPSSSMKKTFLSLHQEQQAQGSASFEPRSPTTPSAPGLTSRIHPGSDSLNPRPGPSPHFDGLRSPRPALPTTVPNTPSKPEYSSPMFRRYELMIEYANLSKFNHCPSNMYVLPAMDNLHEWFGVLFIHQGPYEGGTFRFVVKIPEHYPHARPIIVFLTDMFHPLVGKTGEFSLAQRFSEWTPNQHFIFHILHYIKSAFKLSTLKSLHDVHCPNRKAFRMFHEEPAIYHRLAKQCAQLSSSEAVLNDHGPSNNPIRFTEPTSETNPSQSRRADSAMTSSCSNRSRTDRDSDSSDDDKLFDSPFSGFKNFANNLNRLVNN
ncbi:hypothetical protein H4R35_004809 [Dimargaris xerosporica]|nr:hypothetical protein H4R35_004809 [Dimargaris xerosporica]